MNKQMNMNINKVRLAPMTPEMYGEYFKEYENDPDLYLDPEKYAPYEYSEERVARYIQRQADLNRITLAIICEEEIAGEIAGENVGETAGEVAGEIVGEIVIKNIEPGREATIGLTLKNAGYKDRGIGTQAEKLAVQYIFRDLDIPVVYADTIRTNTRSQHVLEKVGFTLIREDEEFKYYEIIRDPDL